MLMHVLFCLGSGFPSLSTDVSVVKETSAKKRISLYTSLIRVGFHSSSIFTYLLVLKFRSQAQTDGKSTVLEDRSHATYSEWKLYGFRFPGLFS